MTNSFSHDHVPSAVSRRSVVRGAAWSLPVIATAVAVPLAAASVPEFVCPVLNFPTGWTVKSPASGRFWKKSSSDGFYNMANGSGWAYYVRSDAERDQFQTDPTVVTLSQFITPEAGTTYHFTWGILHNGGGSDNTSNAVAAVAVVKWNDVTLWQGTTNPSSSSQLAKVTDKKLAPESHTASSMKTASYTVPSDWPANTPVEITLNWRLSPTAWLKEVNDDIAFGLPAVTCTRQQK